MDAALRVMEAAGARIEPEFIKIGKELYLAGHPTGMDEAAWESIRRSQVIFKAPITTPQGTGYKSLNVTIRTALGLFANLRPVKALNPYIETHYPDMDIVIVRENEEDLYAGIEHRQTVDTTQSLKLITRPGSERIIRYAFEYARTYNRRKVTCMIKDNIMKISDGLFHSIFDEIAAEYPEIESNQQIIDIGTARVATAPERYDVIVTTNLYGDIISDVVAEVSGSVGMAGSANIGVNAAMFEAIHGSAPDIAGKNMANPSGLLNAAILMLAHIGQPDVAGLIHNAWLRTIEDGLHTADIYRPGHSDHLVGTREFADAVVERVGQAPQRLGAWAIDSSRDTRITVPGYTRPVVTKQLVGSDLFIDYPGKTGAGAGGDESAADAAERAAEVSALGSAVEKIAAESGAGLALRWITNRGVKVYPQGFPDAAVTDHWRCRFVAANPDAGASGASRSATREETPVYAPVDHGSITTLMNALTGAGYEVVKTENLYLFDGEPSFSPAPGE